MQTKVNSIKGVLEHMTYELSDLFSVEVCRKYLVKCAILLCAALSPFTAKAQEQEYLLISSACFDQTVTKFSWSSLFGEPQEVSSNIEKRRQKIIEISSNLKNLTEAEFNDKFSNLNHNIYRQNRISRPHKSLSSYFEIDKISTLSDMDQIIFATFAELDLVNYVAKSYFESSKVDEEVDSFLARFYADGDTEIVNFLADEINRNAVKTLIDKFTRDEFIEYDKSIRDLKSAFDPVPDILIDFDDFIIQAKIQYDENLNEILTICSVEFFERFNSDFSMKIPEDIEFIFNQSRKKSINTNDVILGANLSGEGIINDVSTCEFPAHLFDECTKIKIKFGEKTLLIMTKRLGVKERYQYKVGESVAFQACVLSEIATERAEEGYDLKAYSSELLVNFRSALVEGLATGRKSNDLDLGVSDAIWAFAQSMVSSDLLPEYNSTFICETNIKNIKITESDAR